jgi:hypothetical protein
MAAKLWCVWLQPQMYSTACRLEVRCGFCARLAIRPRHSWTSSTSRTTLKGEQRKGRGEGEEGEDRRRAGLPHARRPSLDAIGQSSQLRKRVRPQYKVFGRPSHCTGYIRLFVTGCATIRASTIANAAMGGATRNFPCRPNRIAHFLEFPGLPRGPGYRV